MDRPAQAELAADPPAPNATPQNRAILPLLLFLFGLAATALPLLAVPYPPTQDGPAHQNSAMVLAKLETASSPFFDRIYDLRQTPPSNQLASRVMAWMMELGAGAHAGQILWFLLFLAAAAVIVGNLLLIGPEAVGFSLLLFPVFTGILVNLGFVNYLIGVVLFLQSAFLLQAGLRRPSIPWLVALAVLAVATYIAHPFTGIALAATAAPFAAAYLLRWRRARSTVLPGPPFSRLVPLGCLLVCLIVTALAAYEAFPQIVRFIHLVTTGQPGSGPAIAPSGSDTPRERFITLAGLGLVSYGPIDFLFAGAFGLLLLWLFWQRLADRRRRSDARIEDVWLPAIVTIFLLAALVPRQFEWFLPLRLLACLLSLGIVWLASAKLDRPARRVLLIAGAVLNAAWLVWRLQWSAGMQPILAEFASVAPYIPDHSTVLELRSPATHLQFNCLAPRARQLPCGFNPTLHFGNQVVGSRDIAFLSNYQLVPQAGFFPIDLQAPWTGYLQYQSAFEHWPPDASGPPLADPVAIIRTTPPDVILAWDERRATGAPQGLFPDALQPLIQDYRLVFRSQPLGAAYVYQRRPAPPP